MSIDSEPEIIFKWTNLCRLCLSSDSHIDLFSSEVISQDCLSKIRSCLNLLVYYGDPMPSKLCSKCHLKLDEWYQFRKECIENEANVKTRLQPYKDIKFVKDYFERSAKFESSEIVSSSSKNNNNLIQAFEEVNSSVPTQEVVEEFGHHVSSKKTSPSYFNRSDNQDRKKNRHTNAVGGFSLAKNAAPSVGKVKNFTSTTKKITGGKVSVTHERGDENGGLKKRNEWADESEGGLLGTIVSVRGSASALWNTQHKEGEDTNYYYGSAENFNNSGDLNKTNQHGEESDKTCPDCGFEFATKEEFELHTCCMIDSSTHLDDSDGHFEDSISLDSDYDGNDTNSPDDKHPGGGVIRPYARVKITPFKCLACNFYFQSSLDLRRHYSSVSCLGKKTRALDCEFCYRQFLSFNDLLEHQIVHINIRIDLTEDDLICCNQCSLQFPDERRLKNHILVHALRRKIPIKYTCSRCSQVFFQKDTYENHLLVHCNMETVHVKMENQIENQMENIENMESMENMENIENIENMENIEDVKNVINEATPEPRPAPNENDGPSPMVLTEEPVKEEPKKPQGAIRCFRCGQMFASVKQLEHHEAIKHKNPTPFLCRKCCFRFSARSQLLMHLRVHMSKSSSKSSPNEEINEQANSCSICDAKFLLESDLESHMKTHKLPSSEPPSPTAPQAPTDEMDEPNSDMFAKYKCSLCSRLYVRATSCIRHGQQSHKGQRVVPLRLKQAVFLGRRTSLPPGGKVKRKCPKCPKYFFSFNAFSIHAYRNHGLKMQNPSEDPISLETEEIPESPKPDEIESKCPFCAKDIKPSYISLHMKKFHRGEVLDPSMIGKDIPTDSCICRYCLKTCSTPHNRKLHESIHYPVKAQRNQCETCGQKFVERSLYEDHVRTCKSIRCGKCQKIFFKYISLTQHSCSGTKSDESHKCTVCLSAFTSLDLLQIHIKNFHGKKPELSPPQPGTSKNNAKRLERELWREESNKIVCQVGEKFYCTFCDCEFSTIKESNEHRAAHPRGNWYAVQISDSLFQCTICDKFFETRKSSLLHINYHKKNLLPEQPKGLPISLEPEVEIFTDIKPSETPKTKKYNCRYCSAAFRDEGDLQEHLFHTHVNQT